MSSPNGSGRFYDRDGMPITTGQETVYNEPPGGRTYTFGLATLGNEPVRFGVSVLPGSDGASVTWFVEPRPGTRIELASAARVPERNAERGSVLDRALRLAVIWTAEHYESDPVLAYKLLAKELAQRTVFMVLTLGTVARAFRADSPPPDREVGDLRGHRERLAADVERLERLAARTIAERWSAPPPEISSEDRPRADLESVLRDLADLESDGYPAVAAVKAVTPEGTGSSLAFEFRLREVTGVSFRIELDSPVSPFRTMLRAGGDLWTTLDCADGVPDLKVALRRALRVAAGWAGATRRLGAEEAAALQLDHFMDALGLLSLELMRIHDLAKRKILCEPPASFRWANEACERLLVLLELLRQED